MAENSEVKNKKIFKKIKNSLSVAKDGGISSVAAKIQDGIDYWVEIVFDQLDHDTETIMKGIRRLFKKAALLLSVEEAGGVSEVAAKCVTVTDSAVNILADNLEFQFERGKRSIIALGYLIWENYAVVAKYFAALVLIFIVITGAINYYTGYEYLYNGRSLGIVKQQEDVLRVVDVAEAGLTKEYGIDVQLDPKEDFSFKKVSIWNETVDTSDDVLSKLTYMQDTKVSAYGIFVDGKKAAVVESKETAKAVLDRLEEKYTKKDKNIQEENVYFKQEVKVKKINTTVGKLMSENNTYKLLLNGESKLRHTVKLGETPESIAESYGISTERFYELNPVISEEQGSLREGSIVTVVSKAPKITVVAEVVKKYTKSISYKTKEVKSNSVYKGDKKVSVAGEKGKRKVTAQVIYENGKEVDRVILKSKTIKKPVTKVVLVGTKKRPSSVGTGHLINPCPAGYQSSGFGMRWGRLHRGVDLACAAGNSIYAADGGVVVTASYNGSYGYYIKINHQNGMVTTYAHCSALLVSVGDKVYQGQNIARVGNTGNSYGAHCHFEVEVNGVLQNPNNYI